MLCQPDSSGDSTDEVDVLREDDALLLEKDDQGRID